MRKPRDTRATRSKSPSLSVPSFPSTRPSGTGEFPPTSRLCPAPAWADFSDPLEAISGRFGRARRRDRPSRFSPAEQRALGALGLGEDADRQALRQRYSLLVRRYHPDKNGGDRSHEARLGEVIDAYQLLRKSPAFA